MAVIILTLAEQREINTLLGFVARTALSAQTYVDGDTRHDGDLEALWSDINELESDIQSVREALVTAMLTTTEDE